MHMYTHYTYNHHVNPINPVSSHFFREKHPPGHPTIHLAILHIIQAKMFVMCRGMWQDLGSTLVKVEVKIYHNSYVKFLM